MIELEHAKRRALEYVDQGDLKNAVASMGSDLQLRDPTLILLGMRYVLDGDIEGVRRWIKGFR